ncbi:MAG: tetratricopeptide repeat protein [Bacteroidota bacterium]
MIPKTKLFELIEDYCLNNLDKPEKIEFETELKKNDELSEEVKFEKELQAAITEEDVLILREKLGKAAKHADDKNKDGSFELLEGFADIQQLTSSVSPEELLDYYDSLPKVHVYQHELISNENIHQFYKEQNVSEQEDEFSNEDFDDLGFDGLEEALLEKDILDLRDTLSKVSQTVQMQFSTEEIDEYISGELTGKELNEFENELKVNSALEREVKIHSELENALEELDVLNLRDKISNLMNTETSWNVSEQDIEEFIEGTLEGEKLEDFKAELNENTDLKAEVSLRKNVNFSIGENEIMTLRDKLSVTKREIETKELKSIVPDTKVQRMQWWRAGVAIVVILIAVAGLFKNEFTSTEQLYGSYYQAPEWSPQRSVTSDVSYLQEANIHYTNGEYQQAIGLYNQALEVSADKYVYHFYKAASLQNMEQYDEAVPEYSKVINQGDNIFIEEAEWYRSLCYIKLDSKEKAKEQLLAIIDRKGFYENDAKAVLRRLKYSFK